MKKKKKRLDEKQEILKTLTQMKGKKKITVKEGYKKKKIKKLKIEIETKF